MKKEHSESLAAIKQKLLETGLVSDAEFIGCTLEEIGYIKSCQNVKVLPDSFMDFLTLFGKSMGVFSEKLEVEYEGFSNKKQFMTEMLVEDWPDFYLDESAFVFSDHLGYAFSYFVTNTNDDTVNLCVIGDSGSSTSNKDFISWLTDKVDDLIDCKYLKV